MADQFDREDVVAVADCLGDDSAQLRQENDEDERADNMDRAASMLTWMLLTHPAYASGVALPRTDKLVEAVAKAIYSQWGAAPGYVAWVEGGNSLNQDDARRMARRALEEGGIDGVPLPRVRDPDEPLPPDVLVDAHLDRAHQPGQLKPCPRGAKGPDHG